jgi:taurine--2-oxoglutarate transaminase
VIHVFDPYCYRCVFGYTRETCHRECITHIEEIIKFENPDTVAALLMEGVTGSNGIIVPPDDYWPRLREITKKYNILLISDEVMSGFGRTGEWFAVNHWNVVPDIITMAKGLTSSYMPLGAVAVSEPIAQHFEDKYLYMGLTYFGHPMSCAAGIAAINVYKEDHLIENSKAMGKVLGEELERIKRAHTSVGDVRYIGLFSLLELVKDKSTKEPMDAATMGAVRNQLVADGLTTFVNQNWVFACPPLCITHDELLSGLHIVEKALAIADAKARA